MPYSITTKDGITINNIPDDVTPDAPELKSRVAKIRASGGAGALEPEKPSSTLTGFAGAATRGLALPAAGAAVGAALGLPLAGVGALPGALAGAGAATLAQMVGDPIVGTVNQMLGTKYTMPTQAMEDLLTRIGVAQPKTEAERIVQTASAGMAGAGGTAALGRTIQSAAGASMPVTREVGRALASQPVAQIAGGAGAGAAGQIAQEQGAGPVGQIAASLAGGIAGAQLATPRRIQPSAISSRVDDATQRGIPVMTSDIIPPETFIGKTAQRIGERIPLTGTGPVRAAQQQARIDATRDLLRQFDATDAANVSDDVMRDLTAKRAGDISKYAGLKSEVIQRLDSSGQVPVPTATQAIDEQIAKLQGLKSEKYTPVIAVLDDWKNALQGQGLANIEKLRKDIGSAFKAPELAAIKSTGESALSSIYGPLKRDMESFITNTGQRRDVAKWKIADKRLSEMAGELKSNALKSVLRRGDATPEVVNNMLFSQKPSEIRQLYSSLTPAGRTNARTSILSKAADKARFEMEDGTVGFSPDKFLSEVKRMKPQIGVFFQGDDLKQVEGLTRALNMTRRAGQAGVSTATGQEAVPFVAGSVLMDMLGTFGATLATAGGIGASARVYESAPVRNLMLQMGRVAPNSPEEAALAKRLISVIQTQTESSKEKSQTTTGTTP
jgi:hypothetical protein